MSVDIYKTPILNATYFLILKQKKRMLKCIRIEKDGVWLEDQETGYSFFQKNQYFFWRLRTAQYQDVKLPTLEETVPYFEPEDIEEFRLNGLKNIEENVIEFTRDTSLEEFEQSISFLLSLNKDEREDLKRITGFESDELYAELQFFYDFPKSRTEKKRSELISAYNKAFLIYYNSRGAKVYER